jgi:predicted enzyme related to lactoylglutathione lyase
MGEGTWHTGRVIWRELLTDDVDAAQRFYGALLGWRFGVMNPGDGTPYPTIEVGGAPVGGFARMTPGAHSPASWASYVSVEDIDAALHRARARGGAVAMGPLEVPGQGRAAVLTDPWGASIGLFHAAAADAPIPDVPPEGAFCWETLVTPDPAAAVAFYGEVVGWTVGPAPGGGDVPILTARGRPVADVQRASPGRPAAWLTYVAVAALEPVRDRVAALGGEVRTAEVRIPEVGRVAFVADPQGATFALFERAARRG